MLRRKVETSSNASALSILFRLIGNDHIEIELQGDWTSGASGHQFLKICSALVSNRINGLICKLIALDNIAMQITFLTQLENLTINRRYAYFCSSWKMVVLHIF